MFNAHVKRNDDKIRVKDDVEDIFSFKSSSEKKALAQKVMDFLLKKGAKGIYETTKMNGKR